MAHVTERTLRERYPALDPDFALLLEAAHAAGLPSVAELPPVDARARVRRSAAACRPGPPVDLVVDDLVAGVPVRRYRPAAARADVVLAWAHGGGWVTGDLDYGDAFCRELAAAHGLEVVSVDYRLAPESPFPAAVDDLEAVVTTLAADREVVVGGDSAGGNLAAVVARAVPRVVGQLLVYPVLDADLTRGSYVENTDLVLGVADMAAFVGHYVPDVAAERFTPLRAAELTGTPPAVVVVAGHDPLRDEGREYARRLQDAGVRTVFVEFGPLVHGFLRFTAPVAAARAAVTTLVAATAAVIPDPTQED